MFVEKTEVLWRLRHYGNNSTLLGDYLRYVTTFTTLLLIYVTMVMSVRYYNGFERRLYVTHSTRPRAGTTGVGRLQKTFLEE